jgi:lambda repressor-like predicted transcriptional regulator
MNLLKMIKEAQYAYRYAKNVLKSPFPQGEKAISKHDYYAAKYKNALLSSLPEEKELR